MKGIKFIIGILAIIMIGAGFLSVMEVVADEKPKAPIVIRAEVEFPGEGKAWYTVNPKNGCIMDWSDKKGKILEAKLPPPWLKPNKKTIDFGSFTNSQCRQGVIGIEGTPIEYWSYANGRWVCIGAYDPCNGNWYPRCTGYVPCS